jgi:FdhE protein
VPDSWLASHPYLEAIGRLQSQVEAELGALEPGPPAIPDWSAYLDEYLRGVPVLQSERITLDLEPAGTMIASLVERLAARGLTGSDPVAPPNPGLLRYLRWTVMARFLAPAIRSLDAWRDDERWMRRYCPMCGSPPAMAQLRGTDPGRRRFLSCGCCGARWGFRRTACPFCEADAHRLASVTVEGESPLRIDWCESCRGYLKTYDGEGNERLHLSDWSSLHLDVIALDRGFQRAAASLYELPRGDATSPPEASASARRSS